MVNDRRNVKKHRELGAEEASELIPQWVKGVIERFAPGTIWHGQPALSERGFTLKKVPGDWYTSVLRLEPGTNITVMPGAQVVTLSPDDHRPSVWFKVNADGTEGYLEVSDLNNSAWKSNSKKR